MPRQAAKPVAEAGARWFVMTSTAPRKTVESLMAENTRRDAQGLPTLQIFSPYRFLRGRGDDPEAQTLSPAMRARYEKARRQEACGAPGGAARQQSRPSESSPDAAAALRKFLFIKSTKRQLEDLCYGADHLGVFPELRFYNDAHARHLTVGDREMAQFINLCCNEQLRVEVCGDVEGLEANEKVILNTTEFKGMTAYVVAVEHTRQGTNLQVALTLFSRLLTLRLLNVSEKDVLRASPRSGMQEGRLVETAKRKLLAVMEHRLAGSPSAAEMQKDQRTLNDLYAFRHHQFATDATRRAFLAMMLICAHLRHDAEGIALFARRCGEELQAIDRQANQEKAKTDVRAYLLVAMYLATGHAEYRNRAKEYVQQQQPKSELLRRYVRIVRTRRVK